MKFVHVADLHIGKMIYQHSLLEIQRELLFELLEEMNKKQIKLLIIAGDVYDRLIPSQEAVNVLDEFLNKAIFDYHIEVLMISGNHDSSDRLHFASSLLQKQGLYIETYLKKEIFYVEKEDVRFYFMPFAKPSQVRQLFHLEEQMTYQDAYAYYLSQQHFDPSYKNILITHHFVGHQSQTSESEVPISVGGVEVLSPDLFDQFDYVALGHLHAPQWIARETLRYSGSLMRYSFDEVNQEKSYAIVDTKDMSISLEKLHPSLDLKKYKGDYFEFMNHQHVLKDDDFLSLELTNETLIPHAIDQLRVLYPHLLQITYSYLLKDISMTSLPLNKLEQMDTMSLFKKFYKEMKEMDLSTKQEKIIEEIVEKEGDEDENN